MSVKALFTLDDQLMRAAARHQMASLDRQEERSAEQVLTLQTIQSAGDDLVYSTLQGQALCPFAAVLPVLHWINQSLRHGLVDSLVKLNPLLSADPLVHAYALGALGADKRFTQADDIEQCLSGFSLGGRCARSGRVGEAPTLINSIYGQFGYACLFIDQKTTGRQMALGVRATPEASYIFDASLGLLETPTPQDLGNLLSCWLEDPRSPWMGAHYQLWRVTL